MKNQLEDNYKDRTPSTITIKRIKIIMSNNIFSVTYLKPYIGTLYE